MAVETQQIVHVISLNKHLQQAGCITLFTGAPAEKEHGPISIRNRVGTQEQEHFVVSGVSLETRRERQHSQQSMS